MPTEVKPSSQAESDARLLEVIRKIRHQKQRPTVDRICHALLRDHEIELSLDAVEHMLDEAVCGGIVTRISTNSGAVSYREPAETARVAVDKSGVLWSALDNKDAKGKVIDKARLPSSANTEVSASDVHASSDADADAVPEHSSFSVSSGGRRKPALKVDKQTDLSDAVLSAIDRLEVASGKTLEKEIRCHYLFEIAAGADLRHRIRVACKQLVDQHRLVKDGSVFQKVSAVEYADSPASRATGTGFIEETDFGAKTDDDEDLMTSSIFVCSECKAIEEDRTNVISCAECGVDRHTKCMSRAALSLLKSVQLWLCQTCQPCPVCLTSSRTRKQRLAGLLVCELCDQVYHPECCNYPAQSKTKGSWVCPKCQQDNNCLNSEHETVVVTPAVDRVTDSDRLSSSNWKKSGSSRNSKAAVNNGQDETALLTQSDDININGEDGSPVTSALDSSTHVPSSRQNLLNPRVKLTPLRNGDCNLPSPMQDSKADDVVTSASSSNAQRKRSRNVQLSSLFDSLTQFFSTTNERRRRTPFVSSFASDVGVNAWWNSRKTASRSASGPHDAEKVSSAKHSEKNVSDKSRATQCKTDVSKPVTHAASRRHSSAGMPSFSQAVNERRNSVTDKTDHIQTVTVKNSSEKRPRNRTSTEHQQNSTRRLSSCSVDSPLSTVGVAKPSVKGDVVHSSQQLKVERSRLQKFIEAKRHEHLQLVEDVVAARVTDGETKLFITAQTIAQQRLLVSEGVYVLDEEADNNPVVILGKYELHTPVVLPRSAEFISSSKLYVCELCFKWSTSQAMLGRHMEKCSIRHPPGYEIYRQNNLSVYEVDGQFASSYCSSLGLLARLFVGDKAVCYPASQHSLFYVLQCTDSMSSHLVGFFTKMRECTENLTSLFVMPYYENDGYVRFLIELSYHLCKLTSSVGTLPPSLPDEIRSQQKSYLQSTIVDDLLKSKQSNGLCTVDGISSRTAITIDDVLATLRSLNLPVDHNTGVVNVSVARLKECVRRFSMDSRPLISVDPDLIHTVPSWISIQMGCESTVTSEPMLIVSSPQIQSYADSKDGIKNQSQARKKSSKVPGQVAGSQNKAKAARQSRDRLYDQVTSGSGVLQSGKPADGKTGGRLGRGSMKSSPKITRPSGAKVLAAIVNRTKLSRLKRLRRPVQSRPRRAEMRNFKKKQVVNSPATAALNEDVVSRRSSASFYKTAAKTSPRDVKKSMAKVRRSGVAVRRSPRTNATAITSGANGHHEDLTTMEDDDELALPAESDKTADTDGVECSSSDTVEASFSRVGEQETALKSSNAAADERRDAETDTEDELVDVLEDNQSYGCKTPGSDINQSSTEKQLLKDDDNGINEGTVKAANAAPDDKELSDASSVDLASPLVVDTSPQVTVDHSNDSNDADVQQEKKDRSCENSAEVVAGSCNVKQSSNDNPRNTSVVQNTKARDVNPGHETLGERSSCLRVQSVIEQTSMSADRMEDWHRSASDYSNQTNRDLEAKRGTMWRDEKCTPDVVSSVERTHSFSAAPEHEKRGAMWRDGRFTSDSASSVERSRSFSAAPEHENLFLPRQTPCGSMMLPIESRKRPHGDYTDSGQPAAKLSPSSAEWESRTGSRGAADVLSGRLADGRGTVSKLESGTSLVNQNSSVSKFRSSDASLVDGGYRTVGVDRPSSTMSVDRGLEPLRTQKVSDRYTHSLSYGALSPMDIQAAASASGRYTPAAASSHGGSAHRQRNVGGTSSQLHDQQQRLSHAWGSNPVPAHQHPSTHLQHLEDLPYCAPPKGHSTPGAPTPPSLSMTPPVVRMTPPPSATPDPGYSRTCQQQQQQPHRQHAKQHHKTHKQPGGNSTQSSAATARSAASPQFGGVTGSRGRASPSFAAAPAGYDMFSAACHIQQPIGYFAHHQGASALPMGVVGLHHAQMAVAAAANFGQQMHAAASAGAQPNSAAYSAAAAAAYSYLNGAGLQPFNVDINTMMRR